ncbi:MAG: hypothetical protein FWG70_06225 [Oscillospiraceae bacterium]|nr:hypothetical protein [Oscillospiraceae bacterium]
MASFGKKIDDLYRSVGERGLLFVLFSAALFLHIVFALRMNMPSLERGEFIAAEWSAYISGFGYTGHIDEAAQSIGGVPWLNGILYTPFYYLVNNPVARYRCMLVFNGLIASLLPLLTYRISAMLGLQKAWQRVLCAIVAGGGTAAFAYTKFIWTDTFLVFFPFLLFFLIAVCAATGSKVLRFLLSTFTAFILALAPAANPRLWALVMAIILATVYSRFVLRLKTVSYTGFLPAFAIFTSLSVYFGERLSMVRADASFSQLLPNTENIGLSTADAFVFSDYMRSFFTRFFYFTVSTWGIGIIGICLCVFVLYKSIRKRPRTLPEKTLNLFAFFVLFYNFLILFIPADSGRFTDIDSASPLVLLFALYYIFLNGLNLKELLYSSFSLFIVFGLFIAFCMPHLTASAEGKGLAIAVHSSQGISPLRLGFAIDAPVTNENLFFMISAVFCLISLLFVLVCCAERYRSHMVTFCFFLTVIYSGVHAAVAYLPYEAERADRESAAARTISEYVYNSSDAPPTYVFTDTDPAFAALAPTLRFMNRYASIGIAASWESLPEDCFIITHPERISERSSSDDSDNTAIIHGQTDELVFAAIGEKAEAYALSQEINKR